MSRWSSVLSPRLYALLPEDEDAMQISCREEVENYRAGDDRSVQGSKGTLFFFKINYPKKAYMLPPHILPK